MMNQTWKQAGTLFLALALTLSGCQGEKGPRGPAGDDGDTGQNGQNGISSGSITGTVKVSYGTPVANATVTTVPDVDVEATTNAAGAFTLNNVPIGTYSLVVSGTGIAATTVPGVVVVAGTAAAKDVVVAYSPIKVTVPAQQPAGFGKVATITAPTVTGGTAPYTYAWSVVTAPTEITLTGADTATPSFTTGAFKDIAAKVPDIDEDYFRVPERAGLVAMSPQHLKYFTYTVKVRVTDAAGFRQELNVGVPTAMTNSGAANQPRNVSLIANDVTAATYAWEFAAKPAASTVAFDDATIRNPSFKPDVVGTYTLKNGATQFSITVQDYVASERGCGGCHNATVDAKYTGIWDAWSNSAHGNVFFKYMDFVGGQLVWTAEKAPFALINDVEVPWTAWETPTRMTLLEYGLSNGEGAHYGENCVGCHAVGFNKLAVNGGLDEAAGYAFRGDLLHDTGDLTKPDPAAWNAMSAAAKKFAGMQCETCHGPNGEHIRNGFSGASIYKPNAFFDAQSCAVCHDSVGHHDRNMLWSQAGHANLELAIEEGTDANCGRCHSAQGFVAWSKMATPFALQNLAAADVPTVATVEPVTCQACHDPHTTALRVDEHAPIATTSGFEVSGAGAGQLCVVCHSNRRGMRNDSLTTASLSASDWYRVPHGSAQSDVFFGQNAFFMDLTDTVSVHAYVVEGTCAGCHMEKEHAASDLFMQPATTNHSFKPKANICADCHEGASQEALKESVEAKLHDVANAMMAKAASVLTTGNFRVAVTVDTKAGTISAAPSAIAFGGGHGMYLTLTWNAAPVTFSDATTGTFTGSVAYSLANLRTADGSATLPMFVPGSDFVKAYWNYMLVEEDQTFGAHNPGFVQKVLAVTKAKVSAL